MNSTSQPRSSARVASRPIAPSSISLRPSQKFSVEASVRQTASDCRWVNGTFRVGAGSGGTSSGSSDCSSGGDAPISAAPMALESISGKSWWTVRTNGACRSARTPSRSNEMRMLTGPWTVNGDGEKHHEQDGVTGHLQAEFHQRLRPDTQQARNRAAPDPERRRVVVGAAQPSSNGEEDRREREDGRQDYEQTTFGGKLQVVVVGLKVHQLAIPGLVDEHGPPVAT